MVYIPMRTFPGNFSLIRVIFDRKFDRKLVEIGPFGPKLEIFNQLFRFQQNSWQFCATIVFFQVLFIVLFGLFVKYDDDFHKSILEASDADRPGLIAAQDAELTRNFACKYF